MDQMVQIVVLLDWIAVGTNAVNNVVNVIESRWVRLCVCVCLLGQVVNYFIDNCWV